MLYLDELRRFGVRNVSSHSPPTEVANTSAGCPFQDDICQSQDANLRLDTGYIDSNDHLGLNFPPDERFAYRTVMHCAPLRTANYTSNVTREGYGYVRYHYGGVSTGTHENSTRQNFTFEVENTTAQYLHVKNAYNIAGRNYRLSFTASTTIDGVPYNQSGLIPIPSLRRTDGDVIIVFLSGNGVVFSRKVDDPWYQAIEPFRNITQPGYNGKQFVYSPAEAASPMGCVSQYQWCKTNPDAGFDPSSVCGPLASEIDSTIGAAHLFDLEPDFVWAERPRSNTTAGSRLVWPMMVIASNPTGVGPTAQNLGPKSLLSQTLAYSSVQYDIPDNQWQLDVTNWWNTILASTQASFIDTAIGPANPAADPTRVPPATAEEEKMCASQKIRSTSFTSFSVFGLCFVFITGGLIIAISYSLEPLLTSLHKRRGYKSHAHLEWVTTSSLQLHRLAHEELGMKKWSRCTAEVPTTEPGVVLADLDTSDMKHPVLKQPHEPVLEIKGIHSLPASHVEEVASESIPSPGLVPDSKHMIISSEQTSK